MGATQSKVVSLPLFARGQLISLLQEKYLQGLQLFLLWCGSNSLLLLIAPLHWLWFLIPFPLKVHSPELHSRLYGPQKEVTAL